MSRIGKMPIAVPPDVEVTIRGSEVKVAGPKGELTRTFHRDISVRLEDDHLIVTRPTDHRLHRSLHGLTRALLANMVHGVHEGFRKDWRSKALAIAPSWRTTSSFSPLATRTLLRSYLRRGSRS